MRTILSACWQGCLLFSQGVVSLNHTHIAIHPFPLRSVVGVYRFRLTFIHLPVNFVLQLLIVHYQERIKVNSRSGSNVLALDSINSLGFESTDWSKMYMLQITGSQSAKPYTSAKNILRAHFSETRQFFDYKRPIIGVRDPYNLFCSRPAVQRGKAYNRRSIGNIYKGG